jgi:hypothetical protein
MAEAARSDVDDDVCCKLKDLYAINTIADAETAAEGLLQSRLDGLQPLLCDLSAPDRLIAFEVSMILFTVSKSRMVTTCM